MSSSEKRTSEPSFMSHRYIQRTSWRENREASHTSNRIKWQCNKSWKLIRHLLRKNKGRFSIRNKTSERSRGKHQLKTLSLLNKTLLKNYLSLKLPKSLRSSWKLSTWSKANTNISSASPSRRLKPSRRVPSQTQSKRSRPLAPSSRRLSSKRKRSRRKYRSSHQKTLLAASPLPRTSGSTTTKATSNLTAGRSSKT